MLVTWGGAREINMLLAFVDLTNFQCRFSCSLYLLAKCKNPLWINSMFKLVTFLFLFILLCYSTLLILLHI